jgi:hypothetical protein
MSKEKQIEEMARVMNECCNRYDEQGNHIGNRCYECEEWSDDNYCCCSYNTKEATALYNAGYRKQSENTVELPCKVGDTVYRISKRRGVWCIFPREVVSLTYRLDHLHKVVWEIFTTETDILGKSVFLTEAEAEEALAKMKGDEE